MEGEKSMADKVSREIALEPNRCALLFVDVQNYAAHRDGGEFANLDDSSRAPSTYYFDQLENVAIPNMQKLQRGFRGAGIEVVYTVIESLTEDGRDRSLDYKISGIDVRKGSWDAQVVDAISPVSNEIVIPKTSSSVFISTNIDYVLRNLGVAQLVICGLITDQCVESAVRDACDLGYLVTLIPDACVTFSQDRHDASLRAVRGYCRQLTTAEVLSEIGQSA